MVVKDKFRWMQLRSRWPWLCRVDPSKPWENFPIKVNKHGTGLVHAASVTVSDGTDARLWTDRWTADQSIAELAPTKFLPRSGS